MKKFQFDDHNLNKLNKEWVKKYSSQLPHTLTSPQKKYELILLEKVAHFIAHKILNLVDDGIKEIVYQQWPHATGL